MNRESKLAANTEGRFNPVSLKDFNEEHPVLGAYMYSDNGATYTGQYYYGNREGSGKQVYPNGGLYNGEWRQDKKDGFGREVMGSYQANIQDNVEQTQGNSGAHPQQEFINNEYKEGDYYFGAWDNGERSGEGKESKNGGNIIYQGSWRNDMKNGRGVETISEDTGTYRISKTRTKKIQDEEGLEKDEVYTEDVAIGARYDGTWRDNQKHGKGVWTWSDGSRYEGEFQNDEITGFGKFQFFNESNQFQVNTCMKMVGFMKETSLKVRNTEEEHSIFMTLPTLSQKELFAKESSSGE